VSRLVKFQIVASQRLQSRFSERGATAVEYGLLVALIAVIMAVGATLFGSKLSALFSSVSSKL
jgi:pilus assembly protein Flp/PilA